MLRTLIRELTRKMPRSRRAPPAAEARPGEGRAAEVRAMLGAGDIAAAEEVVQSLQASGRADVEVLCLRGDVRYAQKRFDEAVDAYRRAIAVDPKCVPAYAGAGLALFEQGELDDAYAQFQLVQQMHPGDADNLCHMGLVMLTLGNLQHAEKHLRAALDAQPGHAQAANNLGVCLKRLGRHEDAITQFKRAVEAQPDFFWAQNNLGLSSWESEDVDTALRHLGRAVELRPERARGHINLAVVLKSAGDWSRAEEHLRTALELEPRAVDALTTYASLEDDRGDLARAEALYRQAMEIEPDNPEARTGLGELLLTVERFAEGWDHYEYRLHSRESPARAYPIPEWRGENLSRKTILVYEEQGLGDSILFASCIPDLLRQAGRCLIDCQPRLRKLFGRSFPQAEIVADGQALRSGLQGGLAAQIDFCVPIGSLMRRYRRGRVDFPAHRGYLRPDPARIEAWGTALAHAGEGLRVGIAWRGGLAKTGRHARSMDLTQLMELDRSGIQWVSLQHGLRQEERAALAAHGPRPILHWDEAVADMDEMAALIVNLDLVISVCCTVVHVAGAVGAPVWVLAPSSPSWRYLRAGTSLPWYPSATVYRRAAGEGWEPVLRDVGAALDDHAESGDTLPITAPQPVSTLSAAQPQEEQRLRRAVEEAPDDPEKWIALGHHLRRQRKLTAAVEPLEKAHQLDPAHAEAAIMLASCYFALQRVDDAHDVLALLLHYHPEHAEGNILAGKLAYKRADFQSSEAYLRAALRIDPDHVDALLSLIGLLDKQQSHDEMLSLAQHAYGVAATAETKLTLGVAFSRLDRNEEAVPLLEEAVREMASFNVNAHLTLGASYYFTGRTEEALAQYELVLRRQPNNFHAQYYRAHLNLAVGNFEQGWADYDRRAVADAGEHRPFPYPRWKGEPLEGKAVLIYSEQGLGDEIMFASCFPEVLSRAGTVVIECDQKLEALFARSFPQARILAGKRQAVPAWFSTLPPLDYQIFSGSLPRQFRSQLEDFPQHQGYLRPNEPRVAHWRERLAALGPGPKIGIHWRGGLIKTRSRMRSLKLEDLLPVVSLPGMHFVSLQYGKAREDIDAFRAAHGIEVHHWQEAIDDYDETASLCCALDLVVTVCTAIVHLNGALGRPAWVLTPAIPEWRYGRAGERMPWYPSIRLLRQESPGAWEPLIARVADELALKFAAGLTRNVS